MEDAEFAGAKCLTISTALDCSRNYVRGESPPSPFVSSWSPSLPIEFLLKNNVCLALKC